MTKPTTGHLFLLWLLCFIVPQANAQTSFPFNGIDVPETNCYAFTHATIFKDARNTLTDATLVIRKGRIISAAKDAPIPADAVVIDCKGKYIYPSFIDICSNYGMPAVINAPQVAKPLPQYYSATKGAYGWNQAIKSETAADRIFKADNNNAAALRNAGFGAVLTHHPDGVARGTAALVTLANTRDNNLFIRDKAAAVYSFDKGSATQNYPLTPMATIALLRQTHLDAKWYATRPQEEGLNLSLQAWNDQRNLPQLFITHDKWDALRADKIGDEFGVQYIIKAGGNEYQRINEIAATKATYILPLNFPPPFDLSDTLSQHMVPLTDLKHWELAPSQPARFEKNNIPFCFTADELPNPSLLLPQIRIAIAKGLSEQKALEALTEKPASLLNSYDKVGSLEPGKLANFLLTSGPIFNNNSTILQNWIQGIPNTILATNTPTNPTAATPPTQQGNIYFPFNAYGWETKPTRKDVLIKNATVWTSEKEGILNNTDVLVLNGKIARIGKQLQAPNVQVIDATGKHLTAGIVDEHSHIAIAGLEYDPSKSITAEIRIADIINPEDSRIYRELAGGVTTAHLLHGSPNTFGGQTQLIKLRWGSNADDLRFANATPFLKMAIGEAPRQAFWGDIYVDRFPQSRMGVEQMVADGFTRARNYEKQGPGKRTDLALDAILEVLNGKRFVTCHSYQQNDISMLMRQATRFGFTLNTFTHGLEAYKIADKLKAHGANVSLISDWWLFALEAKDGIPYTAAMLQQTGVNVAISSDDGEMATHLNHEAAKAIKYGNATPEEAWNMITINPARMMHIADRVGSIRQDKDADLVLWDNYPLSVYAKVEKTWIDGTILFDRTEETLLAARSAAERTRLVKNMQQQQLLGIQTQQFHWRLPTMHHCTDVPSDKNPHFAH